MTRLTTVAIAAGMAAAVAGGWLAIRSPEPDVSKPASAAPDTLAARSPFASRDDGHVPSGDKARAQLASPTADSSSPGRAREASTDFSRRQELYAAAARADTQELTALIAAAKALPDSHGRRDTLEILLLRYAELDPEAALRSAMHTDLQTASYLVGILAAAAPEETWKRTAQFKDPLARVALQSAIVAAWVAQDPDRAFAATAELAEGWTRDQLLKQVTEELARRNPLLAVELLKGIEAEKSNALLTVVAAEWSRVDPSKAAQWVEAFNPNRRGRLAYAIADAYVVQKPAEALAWALRISRSPGRNLWSHMLGQLAIHNPEEALRIARAGETPVQRVAATSAVLGAIALRDQALALSHLQKLPAAMRAQVSENIAVHVVDASPSAGMEWLEKIENRRTRVWAAMRLGNQLASYDVEMAAEFLDRVPKEARGMWVSTVAAAYMNQDVDKAYQWVKKHQAEAPSVMSNFARMLARRDPELALQLADDVSDEKERDSMLAGILPAIAAEAGETAAQWVERITDESKRTGTVASVVIAWAEYDEPAARKWLMAMKDGPARDQGLKPLVGRAESVDDALALIKQIQSPESRMDAALQAAIRIKREDPDGARTLLRRYPLDPPRQREYDNSESFIGEWIVGD